MGYPGAAANFSVDGDGKSQFGKPTGTACLVPMGFGMQVASRCDGEQMPKCQFLV